MATRNFWIEGRVDGRKSEISGGPQSKDGGFSLVVYMRDEGTSKVGVKLDGFVDGEGRLHLKGDIGDSKGFEVVTER